ncbi:hypothetical protein M3Y98_00035300 [Aphelenchoides besseyi]|nr:hypothetical protein M3Y98_00035300 [Aphelenchoides besseyi]
MNTSYYPGFERSQDETGRPEPRIVSASGFAWTRPPLQFGPLPASIWLNSANCQLLVVRSNTPEWTGNTPLDGPLCRFTLGDRSGYFLVYAKPDVRHWAQQFEQFATDVVLFGTFMERVNGMGFRSALVLANEVDQATIRHLKSPRFLIP